MNKPKIVVLCGSSKFTDIMAVCAWLIERDEKAIAMGLHLLPNWYPNCPADHLAEHEGVQEEMDELHLRKIDMADEIFVVNHEDYIGDSTKREIEYAQSKNKKIRWFANAGDPIGEAFIKLLSSQRECKVCGCTDLDCSQCITDQGEACYWVLNNLCSRCAPKVCTECGSDEIYSERMAPDHNGALVCQDCGCILAEQEGEK